MTTPLRSAGAIGEPAPVERAVTARRQLALVVTSASAMVAGLAVGYALGTAHALQRTLVQGGRNGV